MTELRRFPPPWTVDEATESFCIRNSNGQVFAYTSIFRRRDRPSSRLLNSDYRGGRIKLDATDYDYRD